MVETVTTSTLNTPRWLSTHFIPGRGTYRKRIHTKCLVCWLINIVQVLKWARKWKILLYKVCKKKKSLSIFAIILHIFSRIYMDVCLHILHQVKAQNRIVGVFPEIQANRSVLSSGAHSAAWESTTQNTKYRKQYNFTSIADSKLTRYMQEQCNDQNAQW